MSGCPVRNCKHCHAIRVDQKDYERRVKQAQSKVGDALASGQRDYERRSKLAKKRRSKLPVARLIPSGKPASGHNQDVGGWWANLKARIYLLLRL